MFYVTANNHYQRKANIKDILTGKEYNPTELYPYNGYTYTKQVDDFSFIKDEDKRIEEYRRLIRNFETENSDLIYANKIPMYTRSEIPKHSGGVRIINAPNAKLKTAQKNLVKLFSEDFHMMHHCAAYGFVKRRSTKDMVEKHKRNNYFIYTDFEDFFGSCTFNIVVRNLKQVYPICEIIKDREAEISLNKILSICFLNGSLPQGSPASPFISNLAMIPIDFHMKRKFASMKMEYTRYADNITVSAEEKFPKAKVIKTICEVLNENNTPFRLKREKTYYRSFKGANWSLGMVTNCEHKVSMGYKKKNIFKAMVHNFCKKPFNEITKEEAYQFLGNYSYYRFIDKEKVEKIIYKEKMKSGTNAIIRAKRVLANGIIEGTF